MAELDPLRPDHDYLRDLRACIVDCQSMSMLAGLMLGRGVRFVHVESRTCHGAPWAAIVVQGEPDITVLRGVAAAVQQALDTERIRLRNKALDG